MKTGYSEIRVEKIEKKLIETNYEAGSGSISAPILGSLFPSLFRKGMRQTEKYCFIIGGKKYSVGKEIYDKYLNQDQISVLYSIKDNKVIDIGI